MLEVSKTKLILLAYYGSIYVYYLYILLVKYKRQIMWTVSIPKLSDYEIILLLEQICCVHYPFKLYIIYY